MTPPKRRQPDVMNKNFGPPLVVPPFTSSVGTYSRSSPSDNFVYEEDYQDLDDEEITIKQEPQEVPEFNWTNIHSNGPAVPPIKKETQFDHLQEDPFPGKLATLIFILIKGIPCISREFLDFYF